MRPGDLTPAQREAAMKLPAVALSQQGLQKVKEIMEGLQKVKEIMEGDEVLKSSESGGGAIRLDLAAEAALSAAGEHQLSFRNDHLPEFSVYLVNALVPATSGIKLGGQERDPLQREMRLSFHVTPAATRGPQLWAGALMLCLCLALIISQWKHLRRYLRWRGDKQLTDSPSR